MIVPRHRKHTPPAADGFRKPEVEAVYQAARECSFRMGDLVRTSSNETGIVRYVGHLEQYSGIWLGLELETPAVDDDELTAAIRGLVGVKGVQSKRYTCHGPRAGTLDAARYFMCPSGYGVFILPSEVRMLEPSAEGEVAVLKTPGGRRRGDGGGGDDEEMSLTAHTKGVGPAKNKEAKGSTKKRSLKGDDRPKSPMRARSADRRSDSSDRKRSAPKTDFIPRYADIIIDSDKRDSSEALSYHVRKGAVPIKPFVLGQSPPPPAPRGKRARSADPRKASDKSEDGPAVPATRMLAIAEDDDDSSGESDEEATMSLRPPSSSRTSNTRKKRRSRSEKAPEPVSAPRKQVRIADPGDPASLTNQLTEYKLPTKSAMKKSSLKGTTQIPSDVVDDGATMAMRPSASSFSEASTDPSAQRQQSTSDPFFSNASPASAPDPARGSGSHIVGAGHSTHETPPARGLLQTTSSREHHSTHHRTHKPRTSPDRVPAEEPRQEVAAQDPPSITLSREAETAPVAAASVRPQDHSSAGAPPETAKGSLALEGAPPPSGAPTPSISDHQQPSAGAHAKPKAKAKEKTSKKHAPASRSSPATSRGHEVAAQTNSEAPAQPKGTVGGVTPVAIDPTTEPMAPTHTEVEPNESKEPPALIEPKAVAPVMVEPVNGEPAMVEPVKVEPVGPVKVEPVEPVKVDPVKVDPVKVEPVESVKVEPVEEPVKLEPVKVEPVKVQPVTVEPIKVESAQVEPVKLEPATGQESGDKLPDKPPPATAKGKVSQLKGTLNIDLSRMMPGGPPPKPRGASSDTGGVSATNSPAASVPAILAHATRATGPPARRPPSRPGRK